MKRILFFLLMLVAATATMSAQDEPMERTAAPVISYLPGYDFSVLLIENTDADENARIYYRIKQDGEDYSDWTLYDEPLYFMYKYSGYYALYQIECYAITDGKTASEIVFMEFVVYNELTGNHYLQYYDFYVDGIYYKIRSDSTVEVSTEAIDPTFIGILAATPFDTYPRYSGNVIIPPVVEYEGNVYQVVAINYFAFFTCKDLLSVKIPNTITELSGFACSSVKSIDLPGSVTTIGERAFECSKLTGIVIPNSVTSIGEAAFYHCLDLTSITIGSSVETIGNEIFSYCQQMKSIVCLAAVPPTVENILFCECNADVYQSVVLFVPAESEEDYRAHEEWGRFTHIVPFIGAGPGDIDGSGGIDVDDVTGIIDMILESGVPEYADVNGDGSIDIDDISAILNMLLGGH